MIPVQYIISTQQNLPILNHAKLALQAGCQWIQLQTNQEADQELTEIATQIKNLCRENDATFVIENDIELVKAIEADGVHLTNGITVGKIRQQLGEGFLIGSNASNAEDIILQKRQSADYICCGPFASISETPDSETINIAVYEKIMKAIEEQDVTLPICAFGNIQETDVYDIMETGIRGISLQLTNDIADEKSVKDFLERYISL